MDNFLHALLKETELNRDLKIKPLQLGSDGLWLVYYESIVNYQETVDFIWNSRTTPPPTESFSDLCSRLAGKELTSDDMNKLHQNQVVLLDPNGERAFSFLGKLNNLSRAIASPENEFLPFAPAVTFMESLTTNIGLLRNAFNSKELKIEGFTFTGAATKEASLIYNAKRVDKELLDQVRSCLQKASDRDLQNGQDLIKVLGCNRMNLFPPFYKTEIPAQAIYSILKGRVLLMIDGEPVAYVLPLLFSDFIALEWDTQFPILIMLGLRSLRILSLLIALLTPGLYVALVSVNPEALRTELALSVASSRTGIPLPTFLEMLFLLIVSEITIESTQRLSKVIGATVTLTSGIVLGTAIVEAKLVSSLVIIVLSISATANFAFPNYINSLSIRLMRVGMIVPAGMFGVFGLFGSFIAICFYVCAIERFGVPFMSFLDTRRIGQT
ncbi:spore germination protein [Paenibacillus cremeus]|uniref:spore germination protein n=1 Tax=Paenibacillus cremeus TaxID=2163881 RepID=UPI001644F3DA|nr:spore germination protein [Paenibacillus cremeus]